MEEIQIICYKYFIGNILKIIGTQAVLKELVVKELEKMQVESDYNSNAVYRYKFTFEKV